MEHLREFIVAILILTSGAAAQNLVLTNATVYTSPTAAPITNATIVIRDGKIESLGHGKVRPTKSPDAIDCTGKFIVAGFWNSHVHFETGWENANARPAVKLESLMQDMLTRWGFTAVWDLGSLPSNTLAIRRRVEAWEVPGPKILMAGDIFPKNGHPVYIPAEMQLPEAATPQQAAKMEQQYIEMGLDGLKLFTGAFMGAKPTINMDVAMVKAAVEVAHGHGQPAFAHPQNRTGVDNALAGGVDILAHTIPTEGSFTPKELAQMKHQHTALVPTLALWTTVVPDPAVTEKLVQAGADETKSYWAEGGTILFGTDVGFQAKFDTTEELEFMGRVMPWRDILASLTTNPALRCRNRKKQGCRTPGRPGPVCRLR